MRELNKEMKPSARSYDKRNIIIALLFSFLILNLLLMLLMYSKISKPGDNLYHQDSQNSSEGIDGISKEQLKEACLYMDPELDKIRYLRQQIIDRKVIKEDCLTGISFNDQTLDDIREYNKLVPRLKGFFADQAIKTLTGVFELKNSDDKIYDRINALNYIEIPPEVREYSEIIAELSLYKNCTELLCSDSRLAFIIYSESGGSAGMWPYLWHTEYLQGHDDVKEDLDHLFDLTDRILTSLDSQYKTIHRMKLIGY